MNDLNEVFDELIARDDVFVGSGVSDKVIAAAERGLGVKLGDEFRAYLRRFGWMVIDQEAIFGLGEGVEEENELVAAAKDEIECWKEVLEDFDEDEAEEWHDGYVPIMRDGNCWLLDTRRATCPVLFWDHEMMGGA